MTLIGPRPRSRTMVEATLLPGRALPPSRPGEGLRRGTTGGLASARGGGGLVQPQAQGGLSAGGLDGPELTWLDVGRPDLYAMRGKTVMTMNGPYVIPERPPRAGLRTSSAGL